jgi:hypothetical protein
MNKFCFEVRQFNTAICVTVVISTNNGYALTVLLTTISSSLHVYASRQKISLTSISIYWYRLQNSPYHMLYRYNSHCNITVTVHCNAVVSVYQIIWLRIDRRYSY